MTSEIVTKLIDGIMENEFQHIQEYKEKKYADSNKEQVELTKKSEDLFKKLCEGKPREFQNLLDDFSSAMVSEWGQMCKFYFKEGVRSGVNNLNFLDDVGIFL